MSLLFLLHFKVDGGWSDWPGLGPCNVTCGDGKRTAVRECNNPTPQHDGRQCEGPSTRYEECGEPKKCPGKLIVFSFEIYCARQYLFVNKNILSLIQLTLSNSNKVYSNYREIRSVGKVLCISQ